MTTFEIIEGSNDRRALDLDVLRGFAIKDVATGELALKCLF